MTPSDEPHGAVGIPGEPRLKEGGIESGHDRLDTWIRHDVTSNGGSSLNLGLVAAFGLGIGVHFHSVAAREGSYNPRVMKRPFLSIPVACMALTGCNFHGYDASMAGPHYPFDLHTTDTVDVQVFRDDTHITIVNSTASAWGPSRLWLNQRFSRAIDGLAPGQTLTLDLFSFWDEDGESYPGGGFLSSRPSMPVRLVELEFEPETPLVGFISIPTTGE